MNSPVPEMAFPGLCHLIQVSGSEVRTCIRLQSPGKASPGTGELMSQSFPGEKFGRGSIKNGNLYI